MKSLVEIARECKGFIPDWEWHDDCIEEDILEMLESKDKEGMQAVIELLDSFPLAKTLIQDIRAVLEQEPEPLTKKDYYCLLTHGYETEKCSSMEDAMQKIETYLKKFNLSYKQVFNQCNGAMQVIVYQYSTLYTETFIIHRTREFL